VGRDDRQEVAALPGYAAPVRSLAFSADGRVLATGSGGEVGQGEVRLWHAADPAEAVATGR
jgi:hypothetical protein